MPLEHHRAAKPLRLTSPARKGLSTLIAENAESFDDIDSAPTDGLLERIDQARIVLIGESTHGTSEFYRMRARITKALIERKGFNIVVIEGDWPDTNAIDRYVRGHGEAYLRTPAFSRFPTWMWRNHETREFVDWLREHNEGREREDMVSAHGLDLYSLNNSIGAVLEYLDRVDPQAAETARTRYACFSPWESDPATYGRAAVSGGMETCEQQAVDMLTDLMKKRAEYIQRDGENYFDAIRNAAVIREAERYYRVMYYGSRESWNLRDSHMFDTLSEVLHHRRDGSRAVVWAHNSHVGNAIATEMGTRGEHNIGQLAREHFGRDAYTIGFGTHRGTVAAANNWDEPMEFMNVRPSHEDSYERLFHDSGRRACFLHLRDPSNRTVRSELLKPHLERAIGVIYRPETELLSHYFQAALPAQFDEYIWFDETSAIAPIETRELQEMQETYPFGL
jgi:protein-L-isoaspartate(D-aspartate) O-methyltransferase